MTDNSTDNLTKIKVSERVEIAPFKFIPGRTYKVDLATHKSLGKKAIPPFKK